MRAKHKTISTIGWLIMAIFLFIVGSITGELFYVIIGTGCFLVWMHGNDLVSNKTSSGIVVRK